MRKTCSGLASAIVTAISGETRSWIITPSRIRSRKSRKISHTRKAAPWATSVLRAIDEISMPKPRKHIAIAAISAV